VRLLGVNRSGSEYSCIQNNGFFDGQTDQAAVTAIKSWHANTVRLPLNEDCWLAINNAPAKYSGSNYQSAIEGFVSLLRQNGLYVILDLHWNAGGTNTAFSQQQMADADHAPAFWTSVATAFKGDQGVIFDLYNEPHDVSWSCWLSGGCQVSGWNVAGMQQLLDAVRATGADNVVMAGGLGFAGDLTSWLANEPQDTKGNVVASFHTYNFTGCASTTCWNSQIQPVAAQVPVITGELGENDCAHGYIDGYMGWADGEGVSYLGWAWNTASCGGFPALVSDYGGTPTSFGVGLQTHLAIVNP
jgi:endoglucanase